MSVEFDLGPFPATASYAAAQRLDAADPLASFANRFVDADPTMIYLDGNSLGRAPKTAASIAARVVDHEWSDRLIRSWNDRWWDLPVILGDELAPIVGAQPGEVLMSDATTVNLYKLAAAALAARPDRRTIITDDLNFPSDLHVLSGLVSTADRRVVVVESDGIHGPVDEIIAALDSDTALLSLSSTVFKSGYTYDIKRLTEAAHDVGALVLWDLSHSVGAVTLALGECEVDLAVGCTYKFLNGGPGSPAFLYVANALQAELSNPISGWWADADPFAFSLDFEPATGIRRFHVGTLPMLSLAVAEAGISVTAEAGMDAIAAKGRALVAFVEELHAERLAALGFAWASPRDAARRGAHASLAHVDAWPITQALIEIGRTIPDFRAPDNIRLGLAPLTTSFTAVATAIERLARIVEGDRHASFSATRSSVT